MPPVPIPPDNPQSPEKIELGKRLLDAWVTCESWHYRFKDTTDLGEIPEIPKDERVYRGTAAVATSFYRNRLQEQRICQEVLGILKDTGMPRCFSEVGMGIGFFTGSLRSPSHGTIGDMAILK